MIQLNTKEFTKELEWISRFIERKTSIPVLSNVLFSRKGEFLTLTGTDLEIGGVTTMEVSADGPDFALTAPAALILKYLKKVDDRTVSLIPEIVMTDPGFGPHPESCEIECSCNLKPAVISVTLRLEHGADQTMSIPGIDAWSYPTLPQVPAALAQIGGLETAIPRAVIAITSEASRFTLNGALLTIQGKQAHLIATDGHRLSMADVTAFDSVHVKALIPKKALTELVRLGDSAFFSQDENHAFFSLGVRTIVSRKLTGNFPDYERVMPKDLAYATDVDVAPFRKTLDRVALFADERSNAVLIGINGALSVSATSCGRGAASGKVPIDCVRRLDGENGYYDVLTEDLAFPYCAGFNSEYIAEFLKVADVPGVRFLFNKAANAAEWSAPGWRYVLMPMRDVEGSSDPYAIGDAEMLQWAKDADTDAYKELPTCSACGIPTIGAGRICDVCAKYPAASTVEDRVMAWARYAA